MRDRTDGATLERTRAFWDRNPCDGQADLARRRQFRYDKEPWLPEVLSAAARNASILEVGCGQGTDALYCCSLMRQGSYRGIDYSPNSVSQARRNGETLSASLAVVPTFEVGNAEALPFEDDHFACVMSLGVLHHTPNTAQAIGEVHRVLRPGGLAYVSLYRLLSPKLLGAYLLRGASRLLDTAVGKPGRALELTRALNPESWLGTMLVEGIGVPVLKSYRRGEIERLFAKFSSLDIRPVGNGFRLFGLSAALDGVSRSVFGAQWLVVARK
jgi:SAM-dependent methyltransferase